ncbi:MAG: M23 family metallopeptidase [Bacteroidales bacterium]|nr:M23 family metallopeptidase [Bacteroidales bacterium]MBN2757519.1 M23 family metallopeptidase [Bacteroidales bacterium]
MDKSKFKYDPESLEFKAQDNSLRARFFREFIGQFFTGIVIAFILFLVASYIIVPPKTRKLKRENDQLKKEYANLNERFLETEKVLVDIKKRDENIYKAILESDPNEFKRRDSVVSIKNIFERYSGMNEIQISNFISEQIDKLMISLNKDTKKFSDLAEVLSTKEKMLINIPSIQPLENKNLDLIVYGFGKRIDPIYKTPASHNGLDYSVPEGTKIFATAEGNVTFSGNKRGEGDIIIISHGYGFETRYSHLSKSFVQPGKKVNRGDVIGLVGNTGKSMTPHLHYEVRVNDKPVNPVNFFFADLSPSQYDKMIKLSARGGLSLD